MPSIPTILCSPTLVDWNSYHKFHRHMKPHLSNNYLNLLLPSFPDSRRWCIYLINCLYLLVNWHFRHTFHEKPHKPTSPTIYRPLGAPSSFLLNFRPLAFPSRLPSSHLSEHPTRFTRKKKSSHHTSHWTMTTIKETPTSPVIGHHPTSLLLRSSLPLKFLHSRHTFHAHKISLRRWTNASLSLTLLLLLIIFHSYPSFQLLSASRLSTLSPPKAIRSNSCHT